MTGLLHPDGVGVSAVTTVGPGFVAVGWDGAIGRTRVCPSVDGQIWKPATPQQGKDINDNIETSIGLIALGMTDYERALHDTTAAACWMLERP